MSTLALLTLVPLMPMETVADASAEIEEIVISASQRPQRLTEVPASISILDFSKLAAPTTLVGAEDIVERLAGVQAAVANGTQIAFQIRGIGAVDHQALTPGAAAIYADGVFLATNVQTGALLFDLESVEVLKGPQSTLFGRNASSGAINFRSVRPGAEQASFVSASYGTDDRVDIMGAVGTVLSDRVFLRVAARGLSQDPVLNNVVTGRGDDRSVATAGGAVERYGVKSSLLWQGDTGQELLLRASYELDQGVNPSPRNASLDVDDFEIAVGGDGTQDTDSHFYSVSAEWSGPVGDWQAVSLTAFAGYDQNYGFDFDGAPAPFGDETLNANLSYNREFIQISEEARLQKSFDWGHMLFGASASFDDFSQTYTIWCGELDQLSLLGTCRYIGAPGRVGPSPASDGVATTLVTDIDQSRWVAAAFTRNEVNLTERLTLTLGARLTFEDISGSGQGQHIFNDGIVAFNNRDNAGPAIGGNQIRDLRFNYTGILQYQFDRASLYASVSSGYKSGGFNGEVANNALHYANEGLFGAETVTSYEIGLRGDAGPRLTYAVAGFFQDYQSPQARIFVSFDLPDGSTIISNSLSNLDEAVSYGVEAELAWQPLDGLRIDLSATVLESEIQQQECGAGNADLFDGNRLPFASGLSLASNVSYQHDVSPDIALQFSAAAKYRSAFFLDAEGLADRRQNDYTTVSAEVALMFKGTGLSLSVFGRNLLDTDFALSGFGFIGYNTFRSAPRLLGVQVRYAF